MVFTDLYGVLFSEKLGRVNSSPKVGIKENKRERIVMITPLALFKSMIPNTVSKRKGLKSNTKWVQNYSIESIYM